MTSHPSRLLAAFALVLGALPVMAAAQQGATVTGRVTNEAELPLQGASVSIPTLGAAARTDAAGRYTIILPAAPASGQSVAITARRLGSAPRTAVITLAGASVTQDFQLATAAVQLEGQVITALGIQREKSQLGTAQQQLSASDLTQTRAQNVVQGIQGKVSGVQITGAGTQGGSTNIVIRGSNSLLGNNNPLFVVDGTPVSNANRGGGLLRGTDYGNAISDLNPDDVETLTVLKGPNAAALYGSRAANGVVVITTRKGATSRMRTELNTTLSFERPSILPDFQNRYGQGSAGEFNYVDGADGGVNDGFDQSYGPKLDGRSTGCVFIASGDPRYDPAKPYTYDSTVPCAQFNAPAGAPWLARPDNVASFFDLGRTLSTTLAVSGGSERAGVRLSVGSDQVRGYIPANSFQKTTGLLSGTLKVSSRLTTGATLQYVRNNARNRTGSGIFGSVLEQFFWFGRQVDVDALRDYAQGSAANNGVAGREYNWNYTYHNNPFWLQHENPSVDSRDRSILSVNAAYLLADWLVATVRSGSDIYRFNVDQHVAPGNADKTLANPAYQGGFTFLNDYRNENNTDLMLTADRRVGDRFRFTGLLGGGARREFFSTNSQVTAGITVPGIYNVSNAAIAPTLTQLTTRRQVNSAYGSAGVTYAGWWTVEGTARRDYSSTLPRGSNGYFYPSINSSVVLTDALPALKGKALSYAKLRASVAEVGNDADPYQLRTTYAGVAAKFNGLPQFTLGNTLANAALKPEITRSSEAGLELGFLDGRASLDASLYDKVTRNQIFNVAMSPAGGFTSRSINAGRISNRGVEALLALTPVQLPNGFEWNAAVNVARNRSAVEALAPGVTRLLIGNTFVDAQLTATVGEGYGAIWGYGYQRDTQGNILVRNGLPLRSDTMLYLGNIQPSWTGGVSNTISYRRLSLTGLLDVRRGGRILSYTNQTGDRSGVFARTLLGREVDWNDPGVTVRGIDVSTGRANTVTRTSEEYFQYLGGNFVEPYVYDAGYVKLRELRVSYDLPPRWAARFNASGVGLALTARNLITWTDVPNIDPEFAWSSGSGQGVEFAIPSNPRSLGLNVRITP